MIAVKTFILKRLLLFTLAAALAGSQASAQIFTIPHDFSGVDDGINPSANLILSGNTLYGTTTGGGSQYGGTVFAIHTDGTCYTNLCNFNGIDGEAPFAGLILSGNTLYGTTVNGGTNGNGTVFAINTDGTGFTNLHYFSTAITNSLGTYTNSDGAKPYAGLVLCGNKLYGTASEGGANGNGTVFAINTDGSGFTNLHNFAILDSGTNSDGANPYAALILADSTLYGTAEQGGSFGYGMIFKINTDGTGFTNLYSFTGGGEGANPEASLILSGNKLYGTEKQGGSPGFDSHSGSGTVFSINTDGTDFTTLNDFNPSGINVEAVFPEASLVLSGNTLYGTTLEGGDYFFEGTVFALSLGSIPLNVQSSGQNLVLTWGNPAFSLQSSCALTGQWTTLSNAASPYTLSASSPQAFFRLAYTNSP